jgi:hypothetical protein
MRPSSVSPYKVLALELTILIRGLNLALRFVLELGMLVAFAYWGSHVGETRLVHVGVAILAPALAALFWGFVLSPKAPAKLSPTLRLALSLPVFLLASVATNAAGAPRIAIWFAIVATLNTLLLIGLERAGDGARLRQLVDQ